MRRMRIVAALLMMGPLVSVFCADEASYRDGVLTIPSVNTDAQIGQYQNAVLEMDAQGLWRLTGLRVLDGSPAAYRAPVDQVEVVKTASSPVQVLLRVSGTFTSGCGSPGRVSQRRVASRFEIVLADAFWAYDVALCTANMVPYVKTIPLDVYGLAAGTYAYDVNGISGSFELFADNVLSGDCVGNACP